MKQANEALMPFIPLVSQLPGKHTTLDRILPLMEMLSNPQDKISVIHLAGTSGKTSTAYYMSALLAAAGQKVGLSVSPHIDSVKERAQINGRELSDQEYCELLGEFLDIVEHANQAPTYFELLYAFAIWVFAELGVDYAVVETGMGGMYDATNVVTRQDKICIITDIGYDHTHILGNSLANIAEQKAGIIHQGNIVFMYSQTNEINKVIKSRAKVHKASLIIVEETSQLKNSKMPDYQKRNWNLAYETYQYLESTRGLKHLTSKVFNQTQDIQIPGRMQVSHIDGKTVITDGAHNYQKMNSFIDSYRHLFPDTKPVVLLAFKEGREYEELIPILRGLSNHIIVTKFDSKQDLPISGTDPHQLAAAFVEAGIQKIECYPDQKQAYNALLNASERICVITGSFYLISQLRQ